MTAPADTRAEVISKSLTGGDGTAHVDPQDVEAYLELVAAGLLPTASSGPIGVPCNAVQNNIALRHDTRTALTRSEI